MKKSKVITMLLVFMLSFSLAHSIVLEEHYEFTDTMNCTSECCHHVDSKVEHEPCYYCEFNSPSNIPVNTILLLSEKIFSTPPFSSNLYNNYKNEELIKPPIL